MTANEAVSRWLRALERRHLTSLRFNELRRAVQALSALYVERRGARLVVGEALGSAGKRAAFALFYGPLHFAVVRGIVRGLGMAAAPAPKGILDLGCGSGVASAAWALEWGHPPCLQGVDRSHWAVSETLWTWRCLGLSGRTRRGDLSEARLPARRGALVAAFAVNELPDESRGDLLRRLAVSVESGARVLIVEPLSRRIGGWWSEWAKVFQQLGGEEREWRMPWTPPPTLRLLDKASGLDHRQLGARSLSAWRGHAGRRAGCGNAADMLCKACGLPAGERPGRPPRKAIRSCGGAAA